MGGLNSDLHCEVVVWFMSGSDSEKVKNLA